MRRLALVLAAAATFSLVPVASAQAHGYVTNIVAGLQRDNSTGDIHANVYYSTSESHSLLHCYVALYKRPGGGGANDWTLVGYDDRWKESTSSCLESTGFAPYHCEKDYKAYGSGSANSLARNNEHLFTTDNTIKQATC